MSPLDKGPQRQHFLHLHVSPPRHGLQVRNSASPRPTTHTHADCMPTTSTEGLRALQVTENSTYPARSELDDESITSTTQVTPSQLGTYPNCFTVTMPTYSVATYGLLLLASRQTRWTTNIPDTLIPTSIANNIRQTLLYHIPITIRSNTKVRKPSGDICSIISPTFSGLRPTDSYKTFKVSVIHISIKLITASEYRFQHERATTVNELFPPLQALLHILDAIQPATH